MEEPREALVRDDAGEGAGHVRLMMTVIGRVAVRRDKTSRVVASPRHPQQGELNASHQADDESKAHADEHPLLIELAIHIARPWTFRCEWNTRQSYYIYYHTKSNAI